MSQCLNCGKNFNDQNVRLLMCSRGCIHWFHNYPEKCLREWIELKSGIIEIKAKLAQYLRYTRDLSILDHLGLDTMTRNIKCPTDDCDANITKLYGGIWSSYEFKYRRRENWDTTDLYSEHVDLGMRENFKLTVSTYQTELIGKLVDHIWDHLNTARPTKEGTRLIHMRYCFRHDDPGDSELKETAEYAKKFEAKIKELMTPDVYNPLPYCLPSFDHYVPM